MVVGGDKGNQRIALVVFISSSLVMALVCHHRSTALACLVMSTRCTTLALASHPGTMLSHHVVVAIIVPLSFQVIVTITRQEHGYRYRSTFANAAQTHA